MHELGLPPSVTTSFSGACLSLPDSVTHGTAAKIATLNARRAETDLIDLSIGNLDLPADRRIDEGVRAFIAGNARTIHAFAPVKGFPFLRASIAAKISRMHDVAIDPAEILVTPGGIKGALTVLFHTFLDPGDEAIVPVPNWPHYADMLRLHRAEPRFVFGPALGASALEANITEKTKLVILGDCINPTGKVYATEELEAIARVVATTNVRRAREGASPLQVIFDCPYEAHVLGPRATTFAAIVVNDAERGAGSASNGRYSMRAWTATVTGPGKTYGMHGDRIGYVWAARETIDMAARVQVNTNSFASTYGQIATHMAVQPEMDRVARARAEHARSNLAWVATRLAGLSLLRATPAGGYFLFLDFSAYAGAYKAMGFARADQFLLEEARVAAIDGSFFADGAPAFRHFVRLNCGRSIDLLNAACTRIENALRRLMH